MAFVHNPERGASDLVILAAQDFLGDSVATVHLPARVPLGFHGSWIADRLDPQARRHRPVLRTSADELL
jgi:carotenoid cleavage dioxygenase-like enzyme